MPVLHGYQSSPNGHDLYVTSDWLDFVAIQPGHANSNDGSNNAQLAAYWTSVYGTTNNKPIFVSEAHYAHLNENSESTTFGPAPTAVGMRADADAMVANDPGDGRLIGICYGDWYRVVFCDPGDTLKFDNALADGYYNGVKTTRFPSGSAGASYAGVANAVGNDGETEYLEALGILDDPGGTTVAAGASIQAAIESVPNYGIVNLTADTIYDNVQLNVPAGKIVTLQGSAEWDSAADTGNLLMGGELVTGWVADGANWRASWTGTPITRTQGSTENYNMWARSRDRLTCTLDEGWLHHASSIAEMAAGVPTNMTGHSGQYYFDYGSQTLWVDTDPTGKRVALSTVNRVITGAGTLLIKDLSVGLSRSTTQEGMIRPEGDNWVLDGVEIFASHGVGIQSKGNRTHLIDCHIHHNGQLGLGDSSPVTNPSGVDNTSGGVLEESILEYNNMNWYYPGWEAGATKVAWHDDYTFRHNEVRYNFGMGLWDDINCVNPQYRFNYVHENWYSGIHHEIGMAATIEFNRVELNGTWPTRTVGAYTTFPNQSNDVNHNIGWSSVPGITISESNGFYDRPGGLGYGIIVRHNLVYDNRGGILLRQTTRDGDSSNPGSSAYWNIGITVNNNDVWWDDTAGGWPGAATGPVHGAVDSHSTHDSFGSSSANSFNGNDYTINGGEITPASSKFEWDGSKSFADWQTAGQDADTSGRDASPEDMGVTVTPPGPGGTNGYFLFAGNGAQFITTSDSPNLSAPTVLKVEVLAALSDWTSPTVNEVLVGKYNFNQEAEWRVENSSTGVIQARSTSDGVGANHIKAELTVPAGWVDDSLRWIQVEYNTAAGTATLSSGSDGQLWSEDATDTFTPHTVFDSQGSVDIGRTGDIANNPLNGKVYAVRIYKDYELVADPDFRNNAQAIGGDWVNGGVDSYGNVWAVNGGLPYVPPTTQDQEVVFTTPFPLTMTGTQPATVTQSITPLSAVVPFTMTGTIPGIKLASGNDQNVSFDAPFTFSMGGYAPSDIAVPQSVSPLTVPAPLQITSAGVSAVSVGTPPFGPDPTDRSLGLQYGYFAKISYIDRPGSNAGWYSPDGNYASMPLSVMPQTIMSLRMDLKAETYVHATKLQRLLFHAGDTTTTTYSGWEWSITQAGAMNLALTADGTTLITYSAAGVGTALIDGARYHLRCDWYASIPGAGVSRAYFYKQLVSGSWELLASVDGAVVTGGLWPSNRELKMGRFLSGDFYSASVTHDTVTVLDADFTTVPAGAVSFTPTRGDLVTLPVSHRLVLVPIGRSQQVGFKELEGFAAVSDVFTWESGQEDALMASMADAYAAWTLDIRKLGRLTIGELKPVVNASLSELRYRRPDGTELI